MDSAKRGAYDGFVSTVAAWEQDVRAFRCGLKQEDGVRLRGSLAGWSCAQPASHAQASKTIPAARISASGA